MGADRCRDRLSELAYQASSPVGVCRLVVTKQAFVNPQYSVTALFGVRVVRRVVFNRGIEDNMWRLLLKLPIEIPWYASAKL